MSKKHDQEIKLRDKSKDFGYIDINHSFAPWWGGGIQAGPSNWGDRYYWSFHPYVGFQTPNILGISFAPEQSITPGINFGASGSLVNSNQYQTTQQIGYAYNPITGAGSPFHETGGAKNKTIFPVGAGAWVVCGDINPLNYYIDVYNYIYYAVDEIMSKP